jgi:hypothetical protein
MWKPKYGKVDILIDYSEQNFLQVSRLKLFIFTVVILSQKVGVFILEKNSDSKTNIRNLNVRNY